MSAINFKNAQGCIGRELLEYQLEWVNDKSRFKVGLWARQTGKDFATTAEAVFQSHLHARSTWLIVAPGERQALESLEKAKDWVEVLKGSVERCTENRGTTGAVLNSAEIVLGNKSRIIALPSRPETVRGYSANVILTEFAFHDDPTAIWRALFPSISNPLRGGPKSLRVISTPNGPGDKFHELWTQTDERYVKHRVTIHEAVKRGLKIDVEELRSGLNDPDGWAQEYECEFLDSGGVLLPYELIGSCEDEGATDVRKAGASSTLVCGIDFGRQHDRTVCWTFEKVGDVFWTREVLVMEKIGTPEQVDALRPRLAAAQRVCLDYTGAGVGLGDFLSSEFGLFDPTQHRFGKVELCSFTAQLKAELFSKLRMAFEKRALRVPIRPEIREDLHGVRRVVSRNGQISYRATHNADGHSDRCTALALALRAAGEARARAASAAVVVRNRVMGRAPRRHRV